MGITSRKNQYPGINPHLNSALQARSWRGFHTLHLADLVRLLDDVLPPNYFTASEESLQITPVDAMPLVESIPDEDQLSGLVIYHRMNDGESQPVTRIELLSPANKAGGSHNGQYLIKREASLRAGLASGRN